MRIARLVTDFLTGRRFRMTIPENEAHKDALMNYNSAFAEAARDLEDLVKSKRRRAQTIAELSDAKDYDDESIDDSDRRAQGARRKDMRDAWRGIQSLSDDELFALGDELDDESHMMLVSGRPSRIRFPGARGDSRITPIDGQDYVEDEDDPDEEGRAMIGGDKLARRSVRRGLDRDEYVTGKSFGMRRRGGFDLMALIKGTRQYEMLKSKLQDAVCNEDLDPSVLLVYESVNPTFASSRRNVERALGAVPEAVRRRYGLPALPSGNPFAVSADELYGN